jgi:unsaturated chondroitin disaccharide hydrolase
MNFGYKGKARISFSKRLEKGQNERRVIQLTEQEKSLYEEALRHALSVVDKNLDVFVKRYPHVSTNQIYQAEENELWTSSFFPGMCFLAYEITGDDKYLSHKEEYLNSFKERLRKRVHITHDLGFLYTLTCVADYKLTGDTKAKEIAFKAAHMLAERYNEKGHYIQAWGEIGIQYPEVKIIIDTMLNLPLLYWTEDKRMIEIARNHAITTAKYLIRSDYTSYHTYLMEPNTGKAVCGKTHQGYQDESTWARGQAWAVYGFALSYRYTKEDLFLTVAKETAKVFIKNLPSDYVSYWDFSFTDENPDIRDTSAVAIAGCGLLELSNYVSEIEAAQYHDIVRKIVKNLYERYSTKDNQTSNGILTEGMYHRHDGANECVIWGDYFYMEMLLRLLKDFNIFW